MSIERKKIDDLAIQAGGYFSLPSEDSMAYTELLFDICRDHPKFCVNLRCGVE